MESRQQSRCLRIRILSQMTSWLRGAPKSDEPLERSLPVRALCYLVLKQYKEAVKDCTEALKLDGKNVKALYRRAQAYKALKDYKSSFADISSLLQIEPRNGPAQKLKQEVNQKLN